MGRLSPIYEWRGNAMKYVLDMVHHNPGEKPFETSFLNPEKLDSYGYNGQVFKHINCAVFLEEYDSQLWEGREEERKFIENLSANIAAQNRRTKEAGLQLFYHIDLFVLPKVLIEKHGDRLLNPTTGRIDLDAPDTMKVHEILFRELFQRFPEVDGLIIRVGETYLYDTPYHVGNGPIRDNHYTSDGRNEEAEKEKYVRLLQFLREKVCVELDKTVIFRTWDCYPDKLHANPAYYRDVTEQIKPHEKLVFSIKHTALDFWRRVKFNECLLLGAHNQVVEVQCQREYEGKGAHPMYVMDGVINFFEENEQKKGLRDIVQDSRMEGLYIWSRGGGWHGPYLQNELWCDLNAYVIAQYGKNPHRTEEEIFFSYTGNILHLDEKNAGIFREICLKSAQAILHGRYCEAFDKQYEESIVPCKNWMRDDCLGFGAPLEEMKEYLKNNGLTEAALREKAESVRIWEEIEALSQEISCPDSKTEEYIRTSCKYGLRLYQVVEAIWKKLLCETDIQEAETAYEEAMSRYCELEEEPQCASLYRRGKAY